MNSTVLTLRDSGSNVNADLSPYGYIPTLWICIMFVVLFGVSTRKFFYTVCNLIKAYTVLQLYTSSMHWSRAIGLFYPLQFLLGVVKSSDGQHDCGRIKTYWPVILSRYSKCSRCFLVGCVALYTDYWVRRIACLIISPTPLLGSHFIIFGRLVQLLGPQFSRFRPRLCEKLSCFVLQDFSGWLLCLSYRFKDLPHLCRSLEATAANQGFLCVWICRMSYP